MKFACSRQPFLDALQILSSVTPSRPVRPILEGVRIEGQPGGKGLVLSATDLDVSIACRLPDARVEEGGAIVLPAGRLAGLVRELSSAEVTVAISGQTCEVRAGRGQFKLVMADADEFPALPVFEGDAIEIPVAAFREIGRKTIFAIARERSQYALNGVLLVIQDEVLDAVGSDGRRLARYQRTIENPGGRGLKAIVPPSAITLCERTLGLAGLEKAPAAGDSPPAPKIEIRSTDTHVSFRTEHAEVAARLIEGEFPDYHQVIPPRGKIQATIPVEEFVRALRAAAQLTSAQTQTVKLELSEPNVLVLRSQTPELGEARIEEDATSVKGEIAIGFNPEFLIDALKVVSGPTVEMDFAGPDRAGCLRAGDDFVYVVMPMSLD